jgi:hypothetical protein
MKTTELTGVALDWAVAKCEGSDSVAARYYDEDDLPMCRDEVPHMEWKPSTNWAQGGAIIEREEISISREFSSGRIEWAAWTPAPFRDDAEAFGYGETPLIAAMRCYVASKFGDEVEIPDELSTHV